MLEIVLQTNKKLVSDEDLLEYKQYLKEKIKQEKVDRQIARIRNTKKIYRLKTK